MRSLELRVWVCVQPAMGPWAAQQERMLAAPPVGAECAPGLSTSCDTLMPLHAWPEVVTPFGATTQASCVSSE